MRKILCRGLVYFWGFVALNLSTAPPSYANQWRILPAETVLSLLKRTGGAVVDTDLQRLDPGLLVSVIYIQAPSGLYRCVEYVTEFQFELTRSACFEAVDVNFKK